MSLHESEWNEWKQHPVTKALMDLLEQERETLRRQWEGGSFGDYEKDATVLVNVGNLGTCKGLAFVQELTYDDLAAKLGFEPTKEKA